VKSYQSSYGWDGKIALFGKALVAALARGALAMCAMWVGFLSSFFAGGRKNKINFHQICTVRSKAKSFLSLLFITIVSVFTLVANGEYMRRWAF
jgi:hypothetical protein